MRFLIFLLGGLWAKKVKAILCHFGVYDFFSFTCRYTRTDAAYNVCEFPKNQTWNKKLASTRSANFMDNDQKSARGAISKFCPLLFLDIVVPYKPTKFGEDRFGNGAAEFFSISHGPL